MVRDIRAASTFKHFLYSHKSVISILFFYFFNVVSWDSRHGVGPEGSSSHFPSCFIGLFPS